uniref:Holin protein n=1 Tax=Dulem virus 38 TaxID=3145756 RepID=A0AAU8B093_9CAUD
MKYATATFWEGLLERAIATFAQALLGAFGVGTSIFGLDWKGALGIAGAAALASVLKSFSLPEETDRAIPAPESDGYTARHSSGLAS